MVKNPFISKNILVKKYGAGQQIKNTLKRFNVWYSIVVSIDGYDIQGHKQSHKHNGAMRL